MSDKIQNMTEKNYWKYTFFVLLLLLVSLIYFRFYQDQTYDFDGFKITKQDFDAFSKIALDNGMPMTICNLETKECIKIGTKEWLEN